MAAVVPAIPAAGTPPTRPTIDRPSVDGATKEAARTPAVPANRTAPAVAATPGVAAPVVAGALPAGAVPAVVAAAPDELGLLELAGLAGIADAVVQSGRSRLVIGHGHLGGHRRRRGRSPAECDRQAGYHEGGFEPVAHFIVSVVFHGRIRSRGLVSIPPPDRKPKPSFSH